MGKCVDGGAKAVLNLEFGATCPDSHLFGAANPMRHTYLQSKRLLAARPFFAMLFTAGGRPVWAGVKMTPKGVFSFGALGPDSTWFIKSSGFRIQNSGFNITVGTRKSS